MGKLRSIIFLFLVLTVLACAYDQLSSIGDQGEAPVLTMDTDSIQVSVYDGESALLQGMTAYDAEDGDLTEKIRIGNISSFIGDSTCIVTYVVFDSDNNATQTVRSVVYTDYESPQIDILEPLQYTIGEKFSLTDRISATDVFDGDITNDIKIVSGEVNSYTVGYYPLKLEVENSRGDTTTITVNVHVESTSLFTPVIELTTCSVFASVGQTFTWTDYISSVHSQDGEVQYSAADVAVATDVDLSTPGTYEVVYSYTNAEGYTGFSYIVVQVH